MRSGGRPAAARAGRVCSGSAISRPPPRLIGGTAEVLTIAFAFRSAQPLRARNGCADRNAKAIVRTSAVPPISRGGGREIADPEQTLPARAAAGRPPERIHPAGPVPGQSLRTDQRSGVTHLVWAYGCVTVAG